METVQGIFVAGVMALAMFIMVRGVTRYRPQRGGMSGSGKILKSLLWNIPTGVTRRMAARQAALLTAEGQQWVALLGFGIWVAILVWISWTINAFEGFTAFLGMLWIFLLLRMMMRMSKRRAQAKQQLRFEQLMLAGQNRLLAQLGSLVTQAGGGGFTMLGSARRLDRDGVEATQRRMQQEEEDHVETQVRQTYSEEELRDLLGDQYGMATGQPGEQIPRWIRRLLK